MKNTESRICGVRLNSVLGNPRQLCVEFYATYIFAVTVTLKCLGSGRKALKTIYDQLEPQPSQSTLLQVFDPGVGRIPTEIQNRLGTVRAYGRMILAMPESLIGRAQNVSLTFDLTTVSGSHFSKAQTMIMERRKRDMSLGCHPTTNYGFPITKQEIDSRINWFFEQYPFLCQETEEATDALMNIWTSLIGGFDSPLLDFELGDPLDRIVYGAVKNARRQLDRNRKTRFGLAQNGRNVSKDVPMENLSDRGSNNSFHELPSEQKRKRGIVQQQIRDFTQNLAHIELIERRLFNGERIIDLARELQIDYSHARSLIHRVQRFLSLK